MLKLRTSKLMGDAWMLKAAGSSYEAIPVDIHIYGEIGNLDANASAALWMLKYNPYDELRDFLKKYTCHLAIEHAMYTDDVKKVKDDIANAVEALPYNLGKPINLSKSQTAELLVKMLDGMSSDEIYDLSETVNDDAGDFVAKDLNELFIRVRMNDEYNAGTYNGVCYFRISSTYKNWTNQIWAFVHDHAAIKKVVVERDAESDNEELSSIRNVMIDNMSREDFLSAERLPFLGSSKTSGISKSCYDVISQGKYSDLKKVRANAVRISNICNALKQENLAKNYRRIEASWASRPENR